jgi:hypothetical protein
LFTNIISIIGTIWFPIVVFGAVMAGLICLIVPHAWLTGGFPQFDNDTAWQVLRPVFAIAPLVPILALIIMSMIFVGLLRLSLGQKTSTTFIFFSLGGQVWRMAAALVLAEIALIVLGIVLAVVFVIAAQFGAPHLPPGPAMAAKIVLGVVEALFFFYACFRLFFFLPAVVVAENRIGLGRSWHLGGGNFWRIFLVVLLTVIPVAFVAGIVMQMTILPFVLSVAMKLPHPVGPGEVPAHLMAIFHAMWPIWPTILIIALVQRIATWGLLAGAMGNAYNAVTASPKAAPVEPSQDKQVEPLQVLPVELPQDKPDEGAASV